MSLIKKIQAAPSGKIYKVQVGAFKEKSNAESCLQKAKKCWFFRCIHSGGVEMSEDISKIAMIAIILEGMITYFKEFFVTGTFPWQMILSLILGIIVAVAYKLDLPQYLNLNSSIPYIGNILTGLFISRGSNYLYEFNFKNNVC